MSSPFDHLVSLQNLELLEHYGRSVLFIPEHRPAYTITALWDTSAEAKLIAPDAAGVLTTLYSHQPKRNDTVEIDSTAYRVSNDPNDDAGLTQVFLRRK